MMREIIILEPQCPKCGYQRKFIGVDEYYCKECDDYGKCKKVEANVP